MVRIRLETEAILYLQNQILEKNVELVWSYIVDYENFQNPFSERREIIGKWREKSVLDIEENEEILAMAINLERKNLKSKDALHVSCAIHAECDYFLTTDDKVLNKNDLIEEIEVINPLYLINKLENNEK